MAHANLVRISEDGPMAGAACGGCPSWDQVRSMVQRDPGSLWFIGNEPDRQDYVSAGRYAELYHDFYTFLKTRIPPARWASAVWSSPHPSASSTWT